MFGTLLAFVIDRLDQGLRTGRQAEAVLNLPHIGLVPKLGGTCAGRALTFTSRRNRPRRTRKRSGACRPRCFSNVDQPPQVVLVTSSVPAEGKTTLALQPR